MTTPKISASEGAMTLSNSGNASAGKNVPAFLLKLYNMVNDRTTDDLIKWNATGDSFLVMRHEDFAKDLLPRYYKHNNFSSFVRQLNMYGFHKIPHIEDNAFSKTETSIWEFSNLNFHRDQPDLLCLVTRKKSGETGDKDSVDYQTIMNEIQAIKRHQITISQDLKRIQADNQALWQEQIDTRARHSRHQETIDKILSFLGTLYGNQTGNDKSIRTKKRKMLLEHEYDDSDGLDHRGGARIFDDEETKATFDDMFKSASTSPVLRPLRKPATNGLRSSNTGAPENRFTLPNIEESQRAPVRLSTNPQAQNTTKMNDAPSSSLPTDRGQDHVSNYRNRISPLDSGSYDPNNMQLTSTYQNRLSQNNNRANELEEDLALQDQNIEALASLLGLDPATLNTEALNPDVMNDMGYGNFDDFLNPIPSIAATPAGTSDIPQRTEAARVSSESGSLWDSPGDLSKTYGAEGLVSVKGSAGSTPTSLLNADEHFEEIDMDKARGKRSRKE